METGGKKIVPKSTVTEVKIIMQQIAHISKRIYALFLCPNSNYHGRDGNRLLAEREIMVQETKEYRVYVKFSDGTQLRNGLIIKCDPHDDSVFLEDIPNAVIAALSKIEENPGVITLDIFWEANLYDRLDEGCVRQIMDWDGEKLKLKESKSLLKEYENLNYYYIYVFK